jgi:hypothetical protein
MPHSLKLVVLAILSGIVSFIVTMNHSSVIAIADQPPEISCRFKIKGADFFAFSNDHLYYSVKGKLFAANAETGTKMWEYKTKGGPWSCFITEKTIYVGTSETVTAIDGISGKPKWDSIHFSETAIS